MSHAPPWPLPRVALALLVILLLTAVASVAAALVAGAAGADELTPPTALLGALLGALGVWLVLRVVTRPVAGELEPGHVGLRPVTARMALVVLGFGLAVAVVAGVLTALLADPLAGADLPPELADPDVRAGETDPTVVTLTLGSALSVLAGAVVTGILAEIVLRGFLLPSLVRRAGRTPAVVLVGLISAVTGEAALAPAAAAIGIALCVMYLESGSILPGIALSAGVLAFVHGRVFGWSLPESAGLALAGGIVAVLLVLPLVRPGPSRSWDPGPARS